ncbi:tetratricopeptide repeat protein [Streptomyces sp. AgN23]|nr:tetratricopeptide repeat protein [Streptomyces sp. AgN23]
MGHRQERPGSRAPGRRNGLAPLADAGNPYAANDLALLLGALGRVQEAESLYRQALGKGHLDAANNLAILLEREGRVDEAEALYRSALRGGGPYAALNLGDLLERADRLAEAAALYRRALKQRLEARGARVGHARAEDGQPGRSRVPLPRRHRTGRPPRGGRPRRTAHFPRSAARSRRMPRASG